MSPAVLNGDATKTNGHGHKKTRTDGFGTRAIHVGSEPNPHTGAVIPPISLSTTYKQDAIGSHKVSAEIFLSPLIWLFPPDGFNERLKNIFYTVEMFY